MQFKLLLYIVLLLAGMLLSRWKLIPERVYDKIGHLQTLCLLVLLTSMGINLGLNDQIVRSLATIGVRGVLFGIVTTIASVLSVHIVVKALFRGGVAHDKKDSAIR